MLSKIEKLGGELRPIKSKLTKITDGGMTRKLIDETQLPISTVERTLVDGILYTDEIGGADEILRWTKTALSADLVDFDKLTHLVRSVSSELRSTNAWIGFVLEYMLNAGLVTDSSKTKVKRIVDDVHEQLDRHPTYRWGKQSVESEYFNEWRLHVNKNYVDQLNSTAVFE